MKYICFKTTVSKIIDETISDVESIKSLVQVFKDKQLDCAIRVGSSSTLLEPCRILKTFDSSFMFVNYRPLATLRKTARYDEIDYIELKTDNEIMAAIKPHINRWTLLDPDDLPETDAV